MLAAQNAGMTAAGSIFPFPLWRKIGVGARLTNVAGDLVVASFGSAIEYLRRGLTAKIEMWIQITVTVPVVREHNDCMIFSIPVSADTGTAILRLEVRQDNVQQVRFRCRSAVDPATSTALISTNALGATRPITIVVDMYWRKSTGAGANNGLAEFYFDGEPTPQVSFANLDNDSHTAWDFVAVGQVSSTTFTPYALTLDHFRIGTTRGGNQFLGTEPF